MQLSGCGETKNRVCAPSTSANHGQDNTLNSDTRMIIKHILKTTSGCQLPVSMGGQPFSNLSIRTLGVSNQQ